jgi:hypothetical protein
MGHPQERSETVAAEGRVQFDLANDVGERTTSWLNSPAAAAAKVPGLKAG